MEGRYGKMDQYMKENGKMELDQDKENYSNLVSKNFDKHLFLYFRAFYEGQWANDKAHGNGIYDDGESNYCGEWQDDLRVNDKY